MDARLVVIPLVLVALSAITLWYAISAKGPWWFKLLLIVVIPASGLFAVREMASYQGYPTSQALPLKGELLGVDIREPNPSAHDPGVIHLWVRPLKTVKSHGLTALEYDPMREPRAYRLPYSRDMHERLMQAKEMMKQGEPVLITNGKPGQPGAGPPGDRIGGQRQGPGGGTRGGDYGGPEGQIEFYKMPDVQLPPKDQ